MNKTVWETGTGHECVNNAKMFMKHNITLTDEIKRLNDNIELLLKQKQTTSGLDVDECSYMTKTDVQIDRFEVDNYWIDIVDLGQEFEAWITCKESSISRFMFGMPKEQSNGEKTNYKDFYRIVETNMPDYVDDYCEESCGNETCPFAE